MRIRKIAFGIVLAVVMLPAWQAFAQDIQYDPDLTLTTTNQTNWWADHYPTEHQTVGNPDAGQYADDYYPQSQTAPPADYWQGDAGSDGVCWWNVGLEAMFLFRQGQERISLFENPVTPSENLATSDLDLDYKTGVNFFIRRQVDCAHSFEMRLFQVDEWSATANATTNVADPLRINTNPVVILPTGRTIAAAYGSELQNVEFNWRTAYNDRLTFLAGFRYMELDERLQVSFADPITPLATATLATRASNRMYGFQLGADLLLWDRGGPFRSELGGKAGLFGNSAASSSVFDTGVVTTTAMGQVGEPAFVGEVNLAGVYQMTNCMSLRAGYQLVWIDGVALATGQIPVTNFLNGSGINPHGEVFYHGASAGLEFRF